MTITASEARDLEVAEKVTSVFSVVGAFFIIITFILDSRFRKPINRLVFYAAWGNLFANAATLISRSGIKVGLTSPLCQFQAFLIQWFMPADALWTFAMACNVYLSFFRQYDMSQLRGLEWKYLGGCYGIPFVPALVFLFVSSGARGKVYGDAVLWCWVSEKWNVLRIVVFYGPVWLVIIVTVFIYVKVGLVVFRWRKHLLSLDQSGTKISMPTNDYRMRDIPTSPTIPQRSEVTVTSQVPYLPYRSSQPLSFPQNTYADAASPTSPHHHGRISSIHEAAFQEPTPATNMVIERPPIRTLDANKATMSYCKTSMLFFIALLCTWVPSTVNRVYTLVRPNSSLFGLDFSSGLVLPLQGFWNTLIYIVTSLPACNALSGEIKDHLFGHRAPRQNRMPPSLNLSKHTHRVLSSEDTRADVVISLDGKKRIVHRNYRNSPDAGIVEEEMRPGPGYVHVI